MASSSERQRRRRQRLREAGFVDVTVTVPKNETLRIRRLARAVAEGQPTGPLGRLPYVIRSLRGARSELERHGILHAGVFGSTARGEEREDSDVDIAVDLDPRRVGDLVEFFAASEAVRRALPFCKVDVIDRRTLKPEVRCEVDKDLIHAF
jgi:predicted nucleotidyltransferase